MLNVELGVGVPPAMSLDPQWPVPISVPCPLSPEPFFLPGNEIEENLKVKTQWPRSADEPGVYMAQTGTGTAPVWGQTQDRGDMGLGVMEMEQLPFASCSRTNLICSIYIFFSFTPSSEGCKAKKKKNPLTV